MARLLIIDDVDLVRRVLVRIATGAGHEVHEARTAAEALEVFGFQRFDLVVVDMKLGDDSGLDLLDALEQLEPGLHAIVCSGFEAPRVGLDPARHRFLAKPFSSTVFEQYIEELTRA